MPSSSPHIAVHVLGRIGRHHRIHTATGEVMHTIAIVDRLDGGSPQIAHLHSDCYAELLCDLGVHTLPKDCILDFLAVIRKDRTAEILAIRAPDAQTADTHAV